MHERLNKRSWNYILWTCIELQALLKPKIITTSPQDVTTQMTNIDIFTTVRTTNLIVNFLNNSKPYRYVNKIRPLARWWEITTYEQDLPHVS
jgi:hypothetical protein